MGAVEDGLEPTAAGAGKPLKAGEASKRMHDYLVQQQRRKEEYWLRKYGKVLAAPPPAASLKPSNGAGKLPPINTGGGGRSARGHPPMFHATKAIDSFPSSASKAADRRHNASHIPYHPGLPTQLPPITSSPSKDAVAAEASASGSKRASGRRQKPQPQEQQQQQEGGDLGGEPSAQTLVAEGSNTLLAAQQRRSQGGRAPLPAHLPPLAAEGSVGQVLPSFRGGPVMHTAPHTNVVHQQQHHQHQQPAYASVGPRVQTHNKGMRDLQMELTVLKAIKAREDVLDRLRVACDKLDSSLGGASPLALAPTDPLVRLFYRLVGQLRSRTLDVVETLAAWHRRSQTAEHFVYYGSPYMLNIGPDLDFLDRQPFLRARLHGTRAVEDPFLVQVTPEGIPVEEATAMDLRRGNHRFTSDALRIRMARKVLATYCGASRAAAGPPGLSSPDLHPAPNASALQQGIYAGITGALPGSASSGSSSLQEEEERRYNEMVREHNEGLAPFLDPPLGEPSFAIDQQAWGPMEVLEPEQEAPPQQLQAVESLRRDDDASDQLLQRSRQATPEVLPQPRPFEEDDGLEFAALAPPPHPDAAVEEEGDVPDESEAVQQHAMRDLEEQVEADVFVVVQEPMGATTRDEWHPLPPGAAAGSDAVALAVSGALDYDLDDDAFIDFALGAMVASLEPQYAEQLGDRPFSIAGWEIDRQLDTLVDGLGDDIFSSSAPPTDQAHPVAHPSGEGQRLRSQPSSSHAQPSRPHTSQVRLQLHTSGSEVRAAVAIVPWWQHPDHSVPKNDSLLSQPSSSGQAAAPPPPRPPTAQINLQLHLSGDELRASILPAHQALALHHSASAAPVAAASASRPPTRHVHLHLTQGDDGRLQANLLPAGSAAPDGDAPRPPGGSTNVISLVLHLSDDDHVSASIQAAAAPSRGGSRPATSLRPAAAQVQLLLSVSDDVVSARLQPQAIGGHGLATRSSAASAAASRAASRPGTSGSRHQQQVGVTLDIPRDLIRRASVPAAAHASLGGSRSFDRSGSSLGGRQAGDARLQLVLDLSGEELHAKLLTAAHSGGLGRRLSSHKSSSGNGRGGAHARAAAPSPLPPLAEETGTPQSLAATLQGGEAPEASPFRDPHEGPGAEERHPHEPPASSISLRLELDEATGAIQARLLPPPAAGDEEAAAGPALVGRASGGALRTRASHAQVHVSMAVEGEELRLAVVPARHHDGDGGDAALHGGHGAGDISRELDAVLEELVDAVEADLFQ